MTMTPHTTQQNLVGHSKDKSDPKDMVYTIKCQDCKKWYVGETKLHKAKHWREGTQRVCDPQTTTQVMLIFSHVLKMNYLIKFFPHSNNIATSPSHNDPVLK